MQLFILLSFFVIALNATTVYYSLWSATPITENGVTKYTGTITATRPSGATQTINVKFTPPAKGLSFIQTGPTGANSINYFVPIAPYTSSAITNGPPASEIVALQNAGVNTLEFDQPIGNLVFDFVSINGNQYIFTTDFTIESCGGSNGAACGYWGCGTCVRTAGSGTYTLSGTGEPHGALLFSGSFSTLSWTSTVSEDWNGFEIGTFGLAEDVYPPVAPPSSCVSTLTTIPTPASGCCSIPSLYSLHITNAVSVADQTSPDCTVVTSGSGTLTLQQPGQRVVLSSDPKGTVSPYFDELAIISVITPSGKLTGENVVAWQKDCSNTSLPSVTIPTTATNGGAVDITSLFNGEIGTFSIKLVVYNKYNPYSALDAYICTGSSLALTNSLVGESLASEVAVTTSAAAQGVSVSTVVYVAVGSAVATTLVILIIFGVVGWFILRKNGASPHLTEKFVSQ